MRSRTPLVMMEMLVMILVFAIAAGLCTQAFVYSSKETAANYERDRAVIYAENTAQVIKACKGDLCAAADILGYDFDESGIIEETIELNEVSLSLSAKKTETNNDFLGSAEITITDEDGDEIFSLTTCYQEVSGDE